MGTKNNLMFLLSISLIMIFNSCGRNGIGCAKTIYHFQIGVKAYPNNESIRLGDTLWFEINSPTILTDVTSGKDIDYSGAVNLGTAIGIGKFANNSFVVAADNFTYVTKIGSVVNNPNTAQIREFTFAQLDRNYVFKLGLIPREKGVFSVGFTNAENVYRSTDKCTKAAFQINFVNTNQHYYLNTVVDVQNDIATSRGSYYFKVD